MKAILYVYCLAIFTQNIITLQLAWNYCFGVSLPIFSLLVTDLVRSAPVSRKQSSNKKKWEKNPPQRKQKKPTSEAALFLGSHVS